MKSLSPIFVITILSLALTACAPGAAGLGLVRAAPLATEADPAKASPACPVTQPPDPAFSPPAPWPATYPYDGYYWYGSNALWTELNEDGTWSDLPFDESLGYGQKVVWWREGYDYRTEQQPALTVTGRRLDGDSNAPAETAFAWPATNGYHDELQSFMLVGVEFPSAGCWEITGEYGGERLSFVVRVEE